MQGQGPARRRPRAAAGGRRLAAGRVRRRHRARRPTRKAQRLMDALDAAPNAPSMKLVRRPGPGSSGSGRCASPASARPRYVPGEPDTWQGWEDAAVPPDKLGDYLRDLRRCSTRYGYDAVALRPLRPGLRALRIDFDLLRPSRASRNWRALPRRGGRPGRALRRLALRRARRRPGARRAAAEDVRRRS